MNGTAATQSRHALNLGDLLRGSVRSEVFRRVPDWLQSDAHGGRYVHPAGEWSAIAFDAARALPRDDDAPGGILHAALATWSDRDNPPGGLALIDAWATKLGVSVEQRIVEWDDDAVARYPEHVRPNARVARCEDELDWLLPANGRATFCVLDPYSYAGIVSRRVALDVASDCGATRQRFSRYLQPATVEAAARRVRRGGDGVLLVFATTDGDAGVQPIVDLREQITSLATADEAVATLVALPVAHFERAKGRLFSVGLLGAGRGADVVRAVAALDWGAAWFVRAGLAHVTAAL